MSYQFRVEPHPLGVVVSSTVSGHRELLIPGEQCCGIGVEELSRIARSSGIVEVPDAAADDCLLCRVGEAPSARQPSRRAPDKLGDICCREMRHEEA